MMLMIMIFVAWAVVDDRYPVRTRKRSSDWIYMFFPTPPGMTTCTLFSSKSLFRQDRCRNVTFLFRQPRMGQRETTTG